VGRSLRRCLLSGAQETPRSRAGPPLGGGPRLGCRAISPPLPAGEIKRPPILVWSWFSEPFACARGPSHLHRERRCWALPMPAPPLEARARTHRCSSLVPWRPAPVPIS